MQRRKSSAGDRFVEPDEHADAPYAVALLRARQDRPCRRRAAELPSIPPAEEQDELSLLQAEARMRFERASH
jgi:hypothetical protein